MAEIQKLSSSVAIGPDGEELTLDTIPPATTVYWSARRKAQVVAAVDGGLLTIDDACARYRMNLEEFLLWRRNFYRNGKKGLRATVVERQIQSLELEAFVSLSVPAIKKLGSLPGPRKRSPARAAIKRPKHS